MGEGHEIVCWSGGGERTAAESGEVKESSVRVWAGAEMGVGASITLGLEPLTPAVLNPLPSDVVHHVCPSMMVRGSTISFDTRV